MAEASNIILVASFMKYPLACPVVQLPRHTALTCPQDFAPE
jgi:hypothetical protein